MAYPLNLLVRLVGFFTKFDHSLTRPIHSIVICKFKGMGSIIQSTPLIATLKKQYPNAKIIFVSSIENQKIINEISWIDEGLYVDDRKIFSLLFTSFNLVRKLIGKKIDLYIDLEIYANYSSIIATMSMAHDRFGYYSKTSQYRMGMYTHMMYFNTDAPITEAYLQFARLLKCNEIIHDSYVFDQYEKANKSYFIINPNASDLRIERRWTKESFIRLIQQLLVQYPDFDIHLIGSPSEASYVREISSQFKDNSRVIDFSGKTSISGLLKMIAEASLVITNDTGPMHLAATMRKKSVALFGPCSPQQYAIGPTVYPIYMNLYCSPCVHEFLIPPCKGNNSCMKLIQVSQVEEAVRILMNGTFANNSNQSDKLFSETEIVFGKVSRK